MTLLEAGGPSLPAAVTLPPGAPWWLWGIALVAPTAGYALWVLHQWLRRQEHVAPPASLHCDDCSRLPEATLAAFRAHYGDRVTAFLRHFDRLDEAVMGETITGEDGAIAALHRLEQTLAVAAADAKHLREKHREWEMKEQARREARQELAEQTNPGKGPR